MATGKTGCVEQRKKASELSPRVTKRGVAIALANISFGRTNHRTTSADAEIEELAASMKRSGQIVPISVHQTAADKYKIIYGHRRVVAAKKLGWKAIRADVWADIDRVMIQDMRLTENLHRRNLNPMEEARAIQKIWNRRPSLLSHKVLANRIGKQERYVQDRLGLLRLEAEAQAMVESGRLPVSHAILISRVGDPSKRKMLVGETLGCRYGHSLKDAGKTDYVTPLSQVRRSVTVCLSNLAGKGWPMEETFAGQRPCAGCPDNTATEPLLFEGIKLQGKSDKGNCTNERCFERKVTKWDAIKAKKRAAAGEPAKKKPRKTGREAKPAEKERKFPDTPAEHYALDLWKYGLAVAAHVVDRVRRTKVTSSPGWVATALQFCFTTNTWAMRIKHTDGLKADELIAKLAGVEPVPFPPTFVAETLNELRSRAIKFQEPTRWQGGDLSENTVDAIRIFEALATKLGIKLLVGRPTPPRKDKKKTGGKK